MVSQTCILRGTPDADGGPASPTSGVVLGDPFQGSLADQTRWLISLRWIAVTLVVAGTLTATYVFPILMDPRPLYATALALLMCNIAYAVAAGGSGKRGLQSLPLAWRHKYEPSARPAQSLRPCRCHPRRWGKPRSAVTLATVQMEVDLLVLTAALHFSGGVTNPFCLFYVFHVIIATIILPRNLSFAVGLTAITLFGLLAVNELNAGAILGHYPFQLSAGGGADPESADAFPVTLAERIKALANREEGPLLQDKTIEFHTGGPTPRLIAARSCPVTGLQDTPLGYVIVGQDLTEHKRLEADLLSRTEQVTTINEMLKMSRVRMAQREKMVALGQMAAGIAHEIGNPLASLSSVVQYLGRKCADREQKELCRVVDHHVGRISAILRRMLDHARPATAEYKWGNVNEMVHNTLELIRLDWRAAGVTIVDMYNAGLPIVWLNPQNLEQCLLNLAINALDAMEAKGPRFQHRLEVVKALKDEQVEIRVRDTGVGTSPEVCRRAFESFFTTKEISKGTGLGLFVSYNLITEMDGTIELQSEPGKGTTAIIRIPVRPKKDLLVGPPGDADRAHGIDRPEEHSPG